MKSKYNQEIKGGSFVNGEFPLWTLLESKILSSAWPDTLLSLLLCVPNLSLLPSPIVLLPEEAHEINLGLVLI